MVTTPNRLLRRLIVLLSIFLAMGCATPSPQVTPLKEIKLRPAFKNVQICLLKFVPLPQNYPLGCKQIEFSLSDELYQCRGETIFIPRNYQQIINDTIVATLSTISYEIKEYGSLEEAEANKCDIVIAGALKDGKVAGGDLGVHSFKASLNVRVVLIVPGSNKYTLEKEFVSVAEHSHIGLADLRSAGRRLSHLDEQHTYHPLRSLFAVAAYNFVSDLCCYMETAFIGTEDKPVDSRSR